MLSLPKEIIVNILEYTEIWHVDLPHNILGAIVALKSTCKYFSYLEDYFYITKHCSYHADYFYSWAFHKVGKILPTYISNDNIIGYSEHIMGDRKRKMKLNRQFYLATDKYLGDKDVRIKLSSSRGEIYTYSPELYEEAENYILKEIYKCTGLCDFIFDDLNEGVRCNRVMRKSIMIRKELPLIDTDDIAQNYIYFLFN